MATSRSPNDKDTSTNEDRFARQDFIRNSRWSSTVAIIAIIIVVGAMFIYLTMLR